ncbi:hypothetical protein BKA61DRAFT_667171 [Leptodontidium sp. MPI-SDFR-AT-0119]|nr:hypothetical protein BKA61DRAFT_667171 [Leptodontidium sp. MPI-SDFR-AT-0119]
MHSNFEELGDEQSLFNWATIPNAYLQLPRKPEILEAATQFWALWTWIDDLLTQSRLIQCDLPTGRNIIYAFPRVIHKPVMSQAETKFPMPTNGTSIAENKTPFPGAPSLRFIVDFLDNHPFELALGNWIYWLFTNLTPDQGHKPTTIEPKWPWMTFLSHHAHRLQKEKYQRAIICLVGLTFLSSVEDAPATLCKEASVSSCPPALVIHWLSGKLPPAILYQQMEIAHAARAYPYTCTGIQTLSFEVALLSEGQVLLLVPQDKISPRTEERRKLEKDNNPRQDGNLDHLRPARC